MLSDTEINDFITEQKPINTIKKTKTDIGIFRRWLALASPSEHSELEDICPSQLNCYLRSFFLTVKKQNGDEYEPDSLHGIKNSLDRYLCEKNYPVSVCRGEEFNSSRQVLAATGKQLKKEGKGRKPNRADQVSEEEEELLWRQGIMGSSSPESLQRAIWWRNNFFGLRGRDEHHQLRWGDVTILEDVDGARYLQYEERETKTRKNPGEERPIKPRIYATPQKPHTCPVNLLIEFTHRRPLVMLNQDSPMYLTIHQNWDKPGPSGSATQVWFKNQALGVHSLGSIMKSMSQAAGLPGRKTNHSGRKTTVKRLKEANVSDIDIIQLTGHKNIQSLNSYSTVPTKTQKKMSDTLTSGPSFESKMDDSNVNEFIEIPESDMQEIIKSIEECEKIQTVDTSPATNVPNQEVVSFSQVLSKSFGLGTPMFSGANINGGNFTININYNST